MNSDASKYRRRFGFFKCPKSGDTWPSANVNLSEATGEFQAQKCRSCGTMVKPHKVEELRCLDCLCRPCRCPKGYSYPDEDSSQYVKNYREKKRDSHKKRHSHGNNYLDEDSYLDDDRFGGDRKLRRKRHGK